MPLVYLVSLLISLDRQLETYRRFGGRRRLNDDNIAYAIVIAELFGGVGLMGYTASKLKTKQKSD